jgi:hypothetical protein
MLVLVYTQIKKKKITHQFILRAWNLLLPFIELNLSVRIYLSGSLPDFHLFSTGAFFNGVFLFALAISIFLQSTERFVHLEEIDEPFLVLIIGCVGLGLNLISVCVVQGMFFIAVKVGFDVLIVPQTIIVMVVMNIVSRCR